jgi:pterin-4a-carbinolamine dehydratase
MCALPGRCAAAGAGPGSGTLDATGAGLVAQPGTFKDFAEALAFVNKVGAVAEEEGHHPDLLLAWGKCKVELWTHKINGLTESDFYMAAKADRAFEAFRAA